MVLDWKDNVIDKIYGLWDPWDPVNKTINSTTNLLLYLNLDIKEHTHNNKADLISDTYDGMCYAYRLIQSYFVTESIYKDNNYFLTVDNLIKYIQLIIKSFRHVNVNFIEKFVNFLGDNSIDRRVRLFRMMGIFLSYLSAPTIYESVVITNTSKITTQLTYFKL